MLEATLDSFGTVRKDDFDFEGEALLLVGEELALFGELVVWLFLGEDLVFTAVSSGMLSLEDIYSWPLFLPTLAPSFSLFWLSFSPCDGAVSALLLLAPKDSFDYPPIPGFKLVFGGISKLN